MYDNKLGERIKERRELLNLSQEELGKRCGTTKQTIFKYENSIVVNIPFDRLSKIAKELETTSQYLLFGLDTKHQTAQSPADPKIDEALRDSQRELLAVYDQLSPEAQAQLLATAKLMVK